MLIGVSIGGNAPIQAACSMGGVLPWLAPRQTVPVGGYMPDPGYGE